MKAAAFLLGAPALLAPALSAQGLPAWWTELPKLPRFEATFQQSSESAVFGQIARKGSIRVAKGGRMRVAYDSGLLLVADGSQLIQYDPDTRTAQRMGLKRSQADMPLLNLLLDPAKLKESYTPEAAGAETLRLKPKDPSLPALEVQGRGRFPLVLRWTDGTGAKQVLTLIDPKVPAGFEAGTFRFELPKGARFADGR